jgi:hypothetical protein
MEVYPMAVVDHIEQLKSKHAELEQLIAQENARPRPDDALVSDLKKQKLRIKDELTKLAPH